MFSNFTISGTKKGVASRDSYAGKVDRLCGGRRGADNAPGTCGLVHSHVHAHVCRRGDVQTEGQGDHAGAPQRLQAEGYSLQVNTRISIFNSITIV